MMVALVSRERALNIPAAENNSETLLQSKSSPPVPDVQISNIPHDKGAIKGTLLAATEVCEVMLPTPAQVQENDTTRDLAIMLPAEILPPVSNFQEVDLPASDELNLTSTSKLTDVCVSNIHNVSMHEESTTTGQSSPLVPVIVRKVEFEQFNFTCIHSSNIQTIERSHRITKGKGREKVKKMMDVSNEGVTYDYSSGSEDDYQPLSSTSDEDEECSNIASKRQKLKTKTTLTEVKHKTNVKSKRKKENNSEKINNS
uniref:Uncharacterized protein LOC114344819 n=1 Tax=Diabrotica virgifera virgifera TaxID=50390 RepID=A0A6P7GZ89_DIAVI